MIDVGSLAPNASRFKFGIKDKMHFLFDSVIPIQFLCPRRTVSVFHFFFCVIHVHWRGKLIGNHDFR